jgi:hypothetical protein
VSNLLGNLDHSITSSTPIRISIRWFVRYYVECSVTDATAGQSVARRKYIPFTQNRHFIGRTPELKTLEQKLFVEPDCQKIAVVGLGGIGKTQVVLHFAYSVLEKYPDVSVFWVPALSVEAFELAIGEIARELGIHIAAGREEDAKVLVRRYLSEARAGKWLLVVDNADDLDILKGSGQKQGILRHLPESESGLTVFTTRDHRIAQSLVRSDVIQLSKVTQAEGVDILRHSLVRKKLLLSGTTSHQLLDELDYLPLAITQAAAYVNCNEQLSLRTYLDLLKGSEQDMIYVMSKEMGDPTRYEKTASAVAKTWLVSFKQMVQRDKDAVDLLRHMSCIEWKAIPLSILPSVQPAARMMDAIGTLCSYSFITTRFNEEKYDMHRLVHVAARVWVRQEGMTIETQRKTLEHVCNIFPSDDYENREAWREYMPHAARLNDTKGGENAEIRGTLCLKVGRCLRVDGRILDAVRWLAESRDLRSTLAEEHPSRLHSQHELASAYQANGQVKDAVQLLEHVVAIEKRVLAEEHPSRLASQHNLASAYQANGQVKDAVQLLEHVIAIEKRVLAEDHPDRLASQRALVRAYEAHRRAYRLQSEALRRADEAEADLPSVKKSTAESKEAVRHPTQSTGAFNHTRPSEVKGEGDSAGSKSRKWWRKFTSRK